MLKISFDQKYIYPLEENHRFPMIKYELIPDTPILYVASIMSANVQTIILSPGLLPAI